MFQDFVQLLFPDCCPSCNDVLVRNEKVLCTKCRYHLPQTFSHIHPDKELYKKFWGKVHVKHVLSFLYFNKKSSVQNLIHHYKYKKQKDIGSYIGSWYGQELSDSGFSAEFDMIIPVPLHKSRLRQRGFNQSKIFADGLAESMQINVEEKYLKRVTQTSTQTNKSRISRWYNVEEKFQVENVDELYGKRIVIADDVITTGATLEACARLLAPYAKEISFVSMAYAR